MLDRCPDTRFRAPPYLSLSYGQSARFARYWRNGDATLSEEHTLTSRFQSPSFFSNYHLDRRFFFFLSNVFILTGSHEKKCRVQIYRHLSAGPSVNTTFRWMWSAFILTLLVHLIVLAQDMTFPGSRLTPLPPSIPNLSLHLFLLLFFVRRHDVSRSTTQPPPHCRSFAKVTWNSDNAMGGGVKEKPYSPEPPLGPQSTFRFYYIRSLVPFSVPHQVYPFDPAFQLALIFGR